MRSPARSTVLQSNSGIYYKFRQSTIKQPLLPVLVQSLHNVLYALQDRDVTIFIATIRDEISERANSWQKERLRLVPQARIALIRKRLREQEAVMRNNAKLTRF